MAISLEFRGSRSAVPAINSLAPSLSSVLIWSLTNTTIDYSRGFLAPVCESLGCAYSSHYGVIVRVGRVNDLLRLPRLLLLHLSGLLPGLLSLLRGVSRLYVIHTRVFPCCSPWLFKSVCSTSPVVLTGTSAPSLRPNTRGPQPRSMYTVWGPPLHPKAGHHCR